MRGAMYSFHGRSNSGSFYCKTGQNSLSNVFALLLALAIKWLRFQEKQLVLNNLGTPLGKTNWLSYTVLWYLEI